MVIVVVAEAAVGLHGFGGFLPTLDGFPEPFMCVLLLQLLLLFFLLLPLLQSAAPLIGRLGMVLSATSRAACLGDFSRPAAAAALAVGPASGLLLPIRFERLLAVGVLGVALSIA